MNRFKSRKDFFSAVLRDRYPSASASVIGSEKYPDIAGTVYFYATPLGVVVSAEIFGLPEGTEENPAAIFGFHIHEGDKCKGNAEDPFSEAGDHFNPAGVEHPSHAGDLPPLFGNDGYAWLATLTNRFQIEDILGKTIVIHAMPDDLKTQPSGASGMKIACGVII